MTFHQMRLERDGYAVKKPRSLELDEIAQGEEGKEKDEYEGSKLIINIQEDLDVKDLPISVLGPPSEKRTKHTDEERYFQWQLQWELEKPGTDLDGVPRSDVTHIRTHAQLNRAADE